MNTMSGAWRAAEAALGTATRTSDRTAPCGAHARSGSPFEAEVAPTARTGDPGNHRCSQAASPARGLAPSASNLTSGGDR
jgi:hypothetical protein